MKKIIVAILLLVVLFIAAVYVLIPAQMKISKVVLIRQNTAALSRVFSEKGKWQQWWKEGAFYYNPQNFSEQSSLVNRFSIGMEGELPSVTVQIIDLAADSSQLLWEASLPVTHNPIERLQFFSRKRKLENAINQLSNRIKNFAESDKNIYGVGIKEAKVKDSVLISIRKQFDRPPGIDDIYAVIHSLQQYAQQYGAAETNHPMLHSVFLDDKYEVMVAIPLNKTIPETGFFKIKRMVLGNILEAEVRGGPYTIQKGMQELENYKNDHRKASPAIPFELLITDRLVEKDSSKWVTKLFYPVI